MLEPDFPNYGIFLSLNIEESIQLSRVRWVTPFQ